MKTATVILAALVCAASLCLAEPAASPTRSPSGLRDLAPSEIDQLTLEVDVSSGQSISFRAYGVRYFLAGQLLYTRNMTPQTVDLIAQFHVAKYVSVTAQATGDKGSDGLPEFLVSRIQFHY